MLKEMHIHLEKCVDQGCTVDQTLLGLFAIVFFSVGNGEFNFLSQNTRVTFVLKE
jgi:hypothetical protein